MVQIVVDTRVTVLDTTPIETNNALEGKTMIGISKEGCVKAARQENRNLLRAKKWSAWSLAAYCRLARDNWMKEARSK